VNATELRTLQRRIDRTRKLAIGMMHAAQRMNDELATIEAFVRDSQQPPTDEGRVSKPARNGAASKQVQMEAHRLLTEFLNNGASR